LERGREKRHLKIHFTILCFKGNGGENNYELKITNYEKNYK